MKRTIAFVSLVAICLTLGSQARAQVLFSEKFESDLSKWQIRRAGLTQTYDDPFEGSYCGTFTRQTTGSYSARTWEQIPVVPGQAYSLQVAYRTRGGGGYIGVDQWDETGLVRTAEQWLIGDNGDPSNLSVWDYNMDIKNEDDLGIWKVYQQEYVPPDGVFFVQIKIEDFAGGLPNGGPGDVCFDNISFFVAQQEIQVDIDINPGSDTNTINLGANGVIPVAILSTLDFDASNVDASTVQLGGYDVAVRGRGDNLLTHLEDVNGDGLIDRVCQIDAKNEDPLVVQDGVLCLTGETFDGLAIKGCADVVIVPPVE